ncbi:hypothetical protein SLA_3165 [Streptomyces laurentii]|uniref:Albusnodin family lasso peptide n=1 Tax=Streptomyces laurentii TaxID=39478 RepID=A0A160NYS0_STRLU|nr:hypothetical protein SLA_3165 [Streptomyces laurentii]
MKDLFHTEITGEQDDASLIEIGDLAALTEGQGGGNSEDKRRAYNS